MTVFHWVRHGPTHQKKFTGWRDVPADLSDRSLVSKVAQFLPKKAVVVSSDLTRSIDTASAITTTQTRLPHMPGLREFHFGAWDNMAFDEIARQDPETSRAYWETPGDVAPPGGESWNAAALRVYCAADQLARKHNGHIIAVAHIGAILTQVQRALGCSAKEAISHKIDNLSITEIDLSGPVPRLVRINHLP